MIYTAFIYACASTCNVAGVQKVPIGRNWQRSWVPFDHYPKLRVLCWYMRRESCVVPLCPWALIIISSLFTEYCYWRCVSDWELEAIIVIFNYGHALGVIYGVQHFLRTVLLEPCIRPCFRNHFRIFSASPLEDVIHRSPYFPLRWLDTVCCLTTGGNSMLARRIFIDKRHHHPLYGKSCRVLLRAKPGSG